MHLAHLLERLLAVERGVHRVAARLQHARHHLDVRALVIHDQDARGHLEHNHAARVAARFEIGEGLRGFTHAVAFGNELL